MFKSTYKNDFKVVRILGHIIVWHYGKIAGLKQSVSEEFIEVQRFKTLDPPYIGIGLFRLILSVLRFHATWMTIFKQIDDGKT